MEAVSQLALVVITIFMKVGQNGENGYGSLGSFATSGGKKSVFQVAPYANFMTFPAETASKILTVVTANIITAYMPERSPLK